MTREPDLTAVNRALAATVQKQAGELNAADACIRELRARNAALVEACEDAIDVVDALMLADAHTEDDVLEDLATTLRAALAQSTAAMGKIDCGLEQDVAEIRAALAQSTEQARKGEQRTICEACGNANLAHDRAAWTDDGTSYCPECFPTAATVKQGEEA